MYTMGDVARCSLGGRNEFHNPDLLYKLFGVQAELLIDHAWGVEGCTMADIKAYRPQSSSVSMGQVLHSPYSWEKARLIVKEMTELLALDLAEKGLVTDQIVLSIGYDRESLSKPSIHYTGPVVQDHYGRAVPKHAHGTANLDRRCASTRLIAQAVLALFDRITQPQLLVRRVQLAATHLQPEGTREEPEQLDLFGAMPGMLAQEAFLQREQRRQQAVIGIRRKYGKNAILKGMNFEEGATTRERNGQIGGHKA